MATNKERQAKWRRKAQEAREFQRQHQQGQYTPPGFKLVPIRTLEWIDAEMKRLSGGKNDAV